MDLTGSTRSYFVVCTQIRTTYFLLIVIKNIVELINFGKVHWKKKNYTNAKVSFKHCMVKAPQLQNFQDIDENVWLCRTKMTFQKMKEEERSYNLI